MKDTLAGRLAFLISKLGLTQQEFARRIQYTQAYISTVLNGVKTKPGHRFITAVCREFNVNPDWLGGGKEPMFSIPGVPLPPERAELLARIFMLPDDKQAIIRDIVDAYWAKAVSGNSGQVTDNGKKRKKG